MNTLTINDETVTGEILHKLALHFETEYISVRQLIEARIKAEIERYEKDRKSFDHGLVLPTDLERRLNKRKPPKIDLEKQVYVAFDAFQRNGFFILVDDEQVESLDEKFLIEESTQVSFIKLTPLVGG